MNTELLEQIVKHVFANLLVIPSGFIDFDKSRSIMSPDYLLPEKMPPLNNNMWGCQLSSEEGELKILLADCSDETYKEYALIVHLQDAPAYGVYLVYDDDVDSEAMIACTLDGESWLECNTFFQATFLSGMEQMKQIGLSWDKCKKYSHEHKLLLSFINFHESMHGDSSCEE